MIGAQNDDDNGSNSGSAYIYRHNGVTWIQSNKLLASDGSSNDEFGQSVAISGDFAVIGAHLNDGVGADAGAVYVFKYNGVNWLETQKLTSIIPVVPSSFGTSVDISGNTIVIGASEAAYVFTNNGSSWTQESRLVASDGVAGDLFGTSVFCFWSKSSSRSLGGW